MGRTAKDPLERFHEKYTINENGCWIWHGTMRHNGYGEFWMPDGNYAAHRWYYEQVHGPVPEPLVLDHKCRNRACVNNQHLEIVTIKENLMRGETRAAENAAKTACLKGHPLSGDNLYLQKGHKEGTIQRICIKCKNERVREWRKRQKTKI